ncbi:MAG: hypothetical protein WC322_06850 [Candidatus Paceibacterota bacterium]
MEYDELKLFTELGIDWFSLGSYVIPTKPVDPIRPPIQYHPDQWLTEYAPARDNIPAEFLAKFDTIIVMHVPDWIEQNWDKFREKRVIWRTIGQSTPAIERRMFQYRTRGSQIVRYSPREANLEPNAGCDTIIRFYKDEREFGHWVGAGNEVITVAQDMKHRAEFCNFDAFVTITKGFNAKIYGPKNENAGELNGGFLTYDDMRQKMRDARVYIYTGTQPASYTLNLIEAMMTGAPIVAIGPRLANSLSRKNDINADLYEIIKNGVNGFWSDDINKLREYVEFLVKDVKAARRIGQMGRNTAIELFGKEVVKLKWKQFLNI